MKTVTIHAAVLILVLSLSLVQLDGGWPWHPASASGSGAASQPGVRILDSDETGITLELTTPDFQIEPIATEEITCDRLSVIDYATNDQAGWPALPVRGAMLGIPPDADVTLTVLSVDAEVLPGSYDLCPVPSPIVETAPTGEISFGGYQLIRDPQAYGSDIFTPASSAELVETGFIRSQRVAQVRFHPFQYNPASGEVRHLERIQVRLEFNRDFSLDGAASGAIDEGAFEETLSNNLLNYDAARGWRTRTAPLDQGQQDWPLPAQTEPSYKIMVDEDGIYAVSYADLQAAGIATATLDALDPRTFHVDNQGEEIAIYVSGEEDGAFDIGDYILFYGQKMNTRYTDVNVYWLTWGTENGSRMATIDGTLSGTGAVPPYFLTTVHLEEDHEYTSKHTCGPENDHWYWDAVVAYDAAASNSYTTTLHPATTAPFSATVRGLLRGYSAPSEHYTQVYLNGNLIDDATWAVQTEYSFEAEVPQSYLFTGANTISVTCGISETPELILIYWFEIDYYATYAVDENALLFDGDETGTWEYQATGFTTDTLDILDITEPLSPTRILSASISGASGAYTLTFQHTIIGEHHYLALAPAQRCSPLQIERDNPADLHSTANSADYIIITHVDFYTEAQRLAAYSVMTRGLRTVAVDVQDVYDEFSYGIYHQEAIHDFLAYAYANWGPPAPAYILLVGDGNYDFKDNLGRGEPSYVPPYLAYVDPWIGETAADNRYVCVSGEDIFPDMHLGRLPVKTSAEASALVDKLLNYEQNPPGGDWNEQLLFVADNADSGGDFDALSDDIAENYVPSNYSTHKVYYDVTHLTPAEARTAIIDEINKGKLLVNYIGHGSYNIWASEHLFELNSIATLTNSGRQPFMIPMTCMEGYFVIPSSTNRDYSSLGEAIVRASGKGAIASWSPTGLGVALGHDYLNKGLFEAIFLDNVTVRLGPATTQGKLFLYSSTGSYGDLLDTYVLFGDPALELNVVVHTWYLPIMMSNASLTELAPVRYNPLDP
ncbi:MAG: hypothetical protein JW918_15550 [Anaerolineae bacterium]|nr:hypothetical protein [Anaerolineae bacterium]